MNRYMHSHICVYTFLVLCVLTSILIAGVTNKVPKVRVNTYICIGCVCLTMPRLNISAWCEIGASQTVLHWIEHGVPLVFSTPPLPSVK